MMQAHVTAALFNATWQGALLAIAAAAVVRLLGRTSASVRCAIWCAVLAVIAILPIVDLTLARSITVPKAPPPVALPATNVTMHAAPAYSAPLRPQRRDAVLAAAHARPVVASAPADSPFVLFDEAQRKGALALDRAASVLFWLWLAGAAVFAFRLAGGLGALVRLRRRFAPLAGDWLDSIHCNRRLHVAACDRVAIPCLVGFVRPTIVIPHPLVAELADDDLRRIVLHEAAHAQRFDDWANLFVQVVRAVFFFNPVVHYIAARISVEREIACDDRVVELSGDRVVYAACLSAIARNVSLSGAHAVPGFFGGRAQIVVRIEQLLDRAHDGSSRLGRKPAVAIGALAIAAVAIARFGIPVIAAQPAMTVAFVPPHAPAAHPKSARRYASAAQVTQRTVVTATQASVARTVVAQVDLPPLPAARWPSAPRIVRHEKTAALVPKSHMVAPQAAQPLRDEQVAPDHAAPAADGPAPSEQPAEPPAAQTTTGEHARKHVIADATPTARPDFIDELSAAGYRGLSVDDLLRLRDHGVTGSYIAAMNAAAGHRLSIDELVTLRDHGVDQQYAGGLAAAGVSVPFDQLITLRDHGVDPHYVMLLQRAGYTNLSASTLVTMRDHGVDPHYVAALNASQGRRLNPDELITLRDHGVDPAYVASLQKAGLGNLTADQLIRLRDHGVDAAYVLRARQYFQNRQPTVDELIKMRDGGL